MELKYCNLAEEKGKRFVAAKEVMDGIHVAANQHKDKLQRLIAASSRYNHLKCFLVSVG
jgi:hypothetical protein